MPRQPRLRGPDTWFHIIQRGADRQDIVHDDGDRLGFENLLGDAVDRFGLEIHAYCLMTNHWHALAHCPDDVISEAMHRVATIHAGRYNHRYARTGPLFEGRFRSVLIETDAQLIQTSRYIHRNPSPIVGTGALAAYRWSSLGPYVGARPAPPWLTTSHVLGEFDGDPGRYRAYVTTPQPSDERVAAAPADDPTWLSLASIEAAVAHAAGVEVAALHESRRGEQNIARLVAIMLMAERRSANAAAIARWFEMGSASSARAAARRARALQAADPSFRQLCERARAESASLWKRSNGWGPSPAVA